MKSFTRPLLCVLAFGAMIQSASAAVQPARPADLPGIQEMNPVTRFSPPRLPLTTDKLLAYQRKADSFRPMADRKTGGASSDVTTIVVVVVVAAAVTAIAVSGASNSITVRP